MPPLGLFPYWFLVGLTVPLGLLFGSFLNVVIHRLPRDESVVSPGSRCPSCGKPIRAYDNVPVLSWLVLRGKARCCGTPISPRYPLVEFASGLLAWAVLERIVLDLPADTSGWRALAIFSIHLALGLGLLAATFIDLEYMILPDEITLGGAVLGLATVPLRDGASFPSSILGALLGFGVIWLLFDVGYRLIRGVPGMGLGDAKLLLLAGAWFGWQGAAFALLAGSVQGTVVAVAVFAAKGRIEEPEAVQREREELLLRLEEAEGDEKEALQRELDLDPLGAEPAEGLGRARIAFGPFLAIATLEYMLLGDALVSEYLSVLWMP